MAELKDQNLLSPAEKSIIFAALNLLANHESTTKEDLKVVLSIIKKTVL